MFLIMQLCHRHGMKLGRRKQAPIKKLKQRFRPPRLSQRNKRCRWRQASKPERRRRRRMLSLRRSLIKLRRKQRKLRPSRAILTHQMPVVLNLLLARLQRRARLPLVLLFQQLDLLRHQVHLALSIQQRIQVKVLIKSQTLRRTRRASLVKHLRARKRTPQALTLIVIRTLTPKRAKARVMLPRMTLNQKVIAARALQTRKIV